MSNKKAVNVGVELQGFYTLKTHTADGKVTQTVGPFLNLILNNGLDLLAEWSPTQAFGKCYVGSGNTPPSASDTQLDTLLATKNTGTGTTGPDSSSRYLSVRRSFEFAQGEAAGNISEIAVGFDDDDLFSRSLIKNVQGDPITITVQANEFLTVDYELRINQPTQDFNFTVDGKTIVLRSAYASSSAWSSRSFILRTGSSSSTYASSGSITDIDSGPPNNAGGANTGITSNTDAYTPGSFSRSGSYIFGITAANVNISALSISIGPCAFQFSIDPPINKTNEDELTIDVSLPWARAGELPV